MLGKADIVLSKEAHLALEPGQAALTSVFSHSVREISHSGAEISVPECEVFPDTKASWSHPWNITESRKSPYWTLFAIALDKPIMVG